MSAALTIEAGAAYDVTDAGNWEHKTILRRSLEPDLKDADTEARLAGCRARLLAVRNTRVKPGWDDKVLADWNGLMIAALAELSRQYRQPAWLEAAERAYAFIVNTMSVGEAKSPACGPLMRITATPARPGAVESA